MIPCPRTALTNLIALLFLALPLTMTAQTAADRTRISQILQTRHDDTACINALYRFGNECLDRSGTQAADLQAATAAAAEINALGDRNDDHRCHGLAHLLQAKIMREAGDHPAAKKHSDEAIRLLDAYGTLAERAQAIIERGGTFTNEQQDLPQKIACYQQGATWFKEAGDTLEAAKINEFVADLYTLGRQYPRAIEVGLESLTAYQQLKYPRLQGVYSILGEAYHGNNNFVQSLRYNLLAVETGDKLHETGPLMATILNRVGLNYYSIRYFDQAMDFFNRSLTCARANNDSSATKTLLLNIADALSNKKELRRSIDTLAIAMRYIRPGNEYERVQPELIYLKNYTALGEYNKAAIHFHELDRAMSNPVFSGSSRQIIRLGLINYLQARGRYKETIPYLHAFEQDEAPISLLRRADSKYLAFKTDSALHNTAAALQHFQQYKLLSDSLNSNYQSRQLGVLRLQFESERKDQDIKFLTQENELQQASLGKEKVVRNVIISGTCLLLVFLALLYNRYRLRKRTTFALEQQQNEINHQNELLKKLVSEKEWLLKEIHHRVKNNLQIIISLLNTQSQYLDNADAIAAIKNSQNRMYAMSLIHQQLYQPENLGKIDMSRYITDLIGYMKSSFDTAGRIYFRIDNDPIQLDVVQAVPIGLILNEAISNAIKYAFPGSRKGTIELALKSEGDAWCSLHMADDGTGMQDQPPTGEAPSLGMSLMQGLAEQLDATYELSSSDQGVSIDLRFRWQTITNEPANHYE
ncbi:histidine kinase dimerization/phosphoacceptor domain -containing protein [Paraflavitalea pollutisoli]|uniref:histidine kinase dimerization/phosphoacceptor domain -containing protein n=1 Tax=Paraflavitalea pollutisoli TaxID=3034143 RepID=UPI0023EBF156|nr:histidine kinase dimerization/phosphoacceptor domain -containing protein [Paraflavitalea sp. H1-2-19X]